MLLNALRLNVVELTGKGTERRKDLHYPTTTEPSPFSLRGQIKVTRDRDEGLAIPQWERRDIQLPLSSWIKILGTCISATFPIAAVAVWYVGIMIQTSNLQLRADLITQLNATFVSRETFTLKQAEQSRIIEDLLTRVKELERSGRRGVRIQPPSDQ